ELPARRDSASRQHGAAKSEGERKDRVLPLDHFQRGGGAAQNAHTIILGDRNEIRSTKTKYEVKGRKRNTSTFALRTSYFLSVLCAGLFAAGNHQLVVHAKGTGHRLGLHLGDLFIHLAVHHAKQGYVALIYHNADGRLRIRGVPL